MESAYLYNRSGVSCNGFHCSNTALCFSYRYLRDRRRPSDATSNMKKLLAQLKNLPLKRKLAMDMGLVDVLHSLPPDFDDGFLSDIARL